MDTAFAVDTSEAQKLLERTIKHAVETDFEDGPPLPIMLHSSPGLGKSWLVKQLAEKYNCVLIDERLSSYEASFVNGVPYVNPHTGQMEWSVPEWYRMLVEADKEGKPAILFFDEINNARESVQHAAYRVLLDHEIRTGLNLPKRVIKVGAGNLRTDKTGAKPMVPALRNRFGFHLLITPNLESALQHMLKYNYDMRVISFLKFRPDCLYKLPNGDEHGYPTYRSWNAVNKYLKLYDPIEEIEVYAGAVGPEVAAEFAAFCKYANRTIDFEEVARGNIPVNKATDMIDAYDEPGMAYASVGSAIATATRVSDDPEALGNIVSVFENIENDEYKAMFLKFLLIRAKETQGVHTLNIIKAVKKVGMELIEEYV